ncbi:BspA family leucine-rich repeat surface protein [Lactococcus piscium]|uniref:BspA family leucine-rich repeat surface protein n=1 Tax=Pseudolactococcus carnosus TaxID=2749961 RepID=UPI001C500D4E|nr:BspA family leucine-rich repeat surface protein [Lactococcus carnosus]MCJ1980934.1 BspA family leucine-rich repeat surface protein [Lactococcus carnosus]
MKQNKLFTLFSLTLLSTGTPLTSIVQAGTIIKDAPAITAASNNDTKIVNKKETKSEITEGQKTDNQNPESPAIDSQKVDKKEILIPTTDEQVIYANPSSIPQALSEAVKAGTLTWGDAPWAFDKDSGILAIGSGQLNEANNSPWRRTDGKAIKADGIKKIIFVGEAQAPTDSANLFANLSSLNQIVGLESFDTSKVIEMSRMFQRASALTSLDLSQLNTSKVWSTVDMFEGCTSLTSLNLSKFDTSSLNNLAGMFKNCSSLQTLDLSSFDTSEVTTMRDMFRNTSLTSLTLGDKFHFLGTDLELTLAYPSDALREGKYVTGNWTNKDNTAVSYEPDDFIAKYGTNDLKAGTYVSETKPLVWGDANWAFDNDSGVLTIASGQLNEAKNSPWNRNDDKKIDKKQIKKIIFTGATKAPKNSSGLFKYLNNLTEIEGLTYLDTSDVTDMGDMFYDCYNLKQLDLSNFNTTKVNTISYMFFFCKSLTSLDLSKFNTKTITDMRAVFLACKSLKSLDLSGFDTSKVTTMKDMFDRAPLSSLKLSNKFRFIGSDSQLPVPTALTPGDQLTGKWIKKNRSSFAHSPKDFMEQYGKSNMTAGTYVAEIKSPLVWGDAPWTFDADSGTLTVESGRLEDTANSPWNRKDDKAIDKKLIKKIIFTGETKAPKKSNGLFKKLTKLTEIEGLAKLDTSDVTDMSEMFYDCYALTKLDLSYFNTSNVESIVDMFFFCASLESLDLSNFNTQKITHMGGAFQECQKLKKLDISGFDTSKVTTMEKMFKKTSLSSLKLGSKFRFIGSDFNLPKPTALTPGDDLTGNWIKQDGNSKTYNTTDFTEKYGTGDLKPGTYVAETGVLKWGDAACSFNADSGVLMVGPGTLSTASYTPWNQKGAKAIDKKLIKKIIFTGETKAPEKSNGLFKKLTKLTEIEGLTNLDTSDVTDMSEMFYDCYALTKLDLSNFNTSNVESIVDMFFYCRNLTTLDLSNFNTQKVTHMGGAFQECQKLKKLDISGFDTSKVTSMQRMFKNTSLSNLTLGDNFKFFGGDFNLPKPTALTPGDDLTGNWIRQDGNSKAYNTTDFTEKYGTGDLKSGTYVAETKARN